MSIKQIASFIFLNLTLISHCFAAQDIENSKLYARGKYLVEGPVACGNCHIQRGPKGEPLFEKGLSGGVPIIEPEFYNAYPSNITPDKETGIGNWTDAQLAKAIREGIRPNGKVIGAPMPIEFYRKFSDEDLKAIIIYIKAQRPVKNVVPKSTYYYPLPANYGPAITKVIPTPSTANTIQYGEYLATISHCMECHNPMNKKGELIWSKLGAGGQLLHGPWGVSVSRNITPHKNGLKDWTDKQIETSIRYGVDRSGHPYKPPMPFDWLKNISENDLSAIIAYLRSLKPLSGS